MEYSNEEAKEIILKDVAKTFVGMPNNENTQRLLRYEIEAQMEQMIKEGKLKFDINIKGDLNL
jgi:hypothetical protein